MNKWITSAAEVRFNNISSAIYTNEKIEMVRYKKVNGGKKWDDTTCRERIDFCRDNKIAVKIMFESGFDRIKYFVINFASIDNCFDYLTAIKDQCGALDFSDARIQIELMSRAGL